MTLEDLQTDNLENIPFTGIGRDDCFATVRKFFDQNFGIKITNYARPHDWSSDKIDLIRMLYEREGFKLISEWSIKDLRPADVLAIAVGEANPNHFAIFLGNDQVLHHLYGRLSRKEPFHGFWRNRTSFVLRHPDVPDLRPVYPDVDIRDLIRARNAPPTN